MKILASTLAATVLASALFTGCNESPRMQRMVLTPGIQLTPAQVIGAGTSTRVEAATANIIEPLKWSVTPNDGKLVVENSTHGQSGIFTSNAPGTYRITASAHGANGDMVESVTSVRVEPGPMTSDRAH